jgi:Zinc finger, C3HC4 type (RING finger)
MTSLFSAYGAMIEEEEEPLVLDVADTPYPAMNTRRKDFEQFGYANDLAEACCNAGLRPYRNTALKDQMWIRCDHPTCSFDQPMVLLEYIYLGSGASALRGVHDPGCVEAGPMNEEERGRGTSSRHEATTQTSTSDDDGDCMSCFTAPATIAYGTCGHVAFCMVCYRASERLYESDPHAPAGKRFHCPVCRSQPDARTAPVINLDKRRICVGCDQAHIGRTDMVCTQRSCPRRSILCSTCNSGTMAMKQRYGGGILPLCRGCKHLGCKPRQLSRIFRP